MNAYLSPMRVALHPAFDLGRGGGGFHGGGFGGGHGYDGAWGVFTERAPFEGGTCGPNEVVGSDGRCHPVVGMGQTAPASSPAAPGTPRGTGAGFSNRRTLGLAAAVVGLGAGATQLMAKNPKLTKVAFWAEMASIAVLAAVVVGVPGMGGGKPPVPTTTSGS